MSYTEHQKTVILARVSTKSQEDEGYSLDSQQKLLVGYCEAKGLKVDRIFKIAETASKQQSRKVFHELLKYLEANTIFHLAVEKTDRLTRNFKDSVAIDDWLDKDNRRMLHAVKENLLLHKEAKSDVKFMWNIHLSMAKKYTDNLREEAMKGWAEKLAQGWLPAPPPCGYMTITDHGKRIHVPDPATTSIMKRMFQLYVEPSHSISSITVELERLGVRTRGGRPYAKSHVQKLLMNPFYIGINHFDGKDYPGAQQPLISKALFDQVQHKMHKGQPTTYVKHNPVFKNLIRCETCKCVLSWQLQKGRYYGGCQRRNKQCAGRKFLREDMIVTAVCAQLEKLVCPSQDIIEWVANKMRSEQQTSSESRERMLTSIQSQLDRLQRMDTMLYDDKLAGEITKEKYDVKHNEFKVQTAELEAEREKLTSHTQKHLEQRLVLLELSQKAATIFPLRTPEQKRLIMNKLFSCITTNDGSVSVKYTKFARLIADNVVKTTNILGGQI